MLGPHHFQEMLDHWGDNPSPNATLAVAAHDHRNGQIVGQLHPDTTFEAASFGKLFAAHALSLRPDLPLDKEVAVTEPDVMEGNGILQYFPLGYKLPLGAVVEQALSISDNTALKIVVREQGGADEVNQVVEDHSSISHKLQITKLKPLDTTKGTFDTGETTAAETVSLFNAVLGVDAYWDALARGNFASGLRSGIEPRPDQPYPRGVIPTGKVLSKLPGALKLPKSLCDKLLSSQWPQNQFPNKEAHYGAYRHDVSLIGACTVAVLTKGYPESTENTTAHTLQGMLGRLAYESFGDDRLHT